MGDNNDAETAANLDAATDYSALKVTELRKLLKSKGLPCTGNKMELVERLSTPAEQLAEKLIDETAIGDSESFDADLETQDKSFNLLIIDQVRKHPMLWNSDKGSLDAYAKARIWRNIARSLGRDERFIKTRWRTLRDRYRKTVKKDVEETGKAGHNLAKWRLAPHLEFLLPQCVSPVPVVRYRPILPKVERIFNLGGLLKDNTVCAEVKPVESLPSQPSSSPGVTPQLSPIFRGSHFDEPPVSVEIVEESKHLPVPQSSPGPSGGDGNRPRPVEIIKVESLKPPPTSEMTSDEHFYLAIAKDVSKLPWASRMKVRQAALAALTEEIAQLKE